MKPAQKITIGACTYSVAPVGAGEGLAVAARLASALAPVFAASNARFAIRDLVANPALLEHVDFLCRTFARSTTVTSAASPGAVALGDVFDAHFAGDYGALIEWLEFATEVNMSSFFDVSPALKGRLVALLTRLGLGPASSAPSPAQTPG